MGATMRLNANVNEGETIRLRPLAAQAMQRIRFQPLVGDLDDETFNAALRSLRDVYVCKDARFVVNINGEPVELCATKVKPEHGWLVEETTIDARNKAVRRRGANIPTVSFADIGGLDDTIEEIKEIAIVPLIHPEVYQKAGQDPPKGILLYGPPGVGKTLLAKALAREAQCNFININGPELFMGTYGDSERKLRDIFAQAKKEAPTVIFIDEIDAIAASRKDNKGQLEKRILTQLLTELDGFEERGQVLVVGSTNIMESIDDALLRAGRFDRRIHVPYPDIEGREHILSIHSATMPLEPDFSLNAWAKQTNGYTGADLANLCRHAAVLAMHRVYGIERLMQSEELSEDELTELEISDEDFELAMDRATPFQVELRRPTNMGFHDMDEIIGHDDAKAELKEHLVAPIQHKDMFEAMGLNCNGGVILHGPPGTGKTMLGKAVASLSGVQFMAVSGPELLSKWVGESERAVRELFQRAQEAAPVVLFFDEFDALGRQRDGGDSSAHSNSVVAQLLTLMDGLGSNEDIYLMASTNQSIWSTVLSFVLAGLTGRFTSGRLRSSTTTISSPTRPRIACRMFPAMNGRRSSSNWWTRRPVQNCTAWSTPPSETRFHAPLPTDRTWPCSNTETSSLLSLRCRIFSPATPGTFLRLRCGTMKATMKTMIGWYHERPIFSTTRPGSTGCRKATRRVAAV